MGFLRKVFGGTQPRAQGSMREMATEHLRAVAAEVDDDLVEIVEVVGESHRQEELARIAGPKAEEGKRHFVGAVLRCEPTNDYDGNAVRVEVLGQHLGYVSRETAALLSPAMLRICGGTLEARGMIVGGWKTDGYGPEAVPSEGSYGIRVWITERDAERLGIRSVKLDPARRPPWPEISEVAEGEGRLSPTRDDMRRDASVRK